jgi:hypothetical protein
VVGISPPLNDLRLRSLVIPRRGYWQQVTKSGRAVPPVEARCRAALDWAAEGGCPYMSSTYSETLCSSFGKRRTRTEYDAPHNRRSSNPLKSLLTPAGFPMSADWHEP